MKKILFFIVATSLVALIGIDFNLDLSLSQTQAQLKEVNMTKTIDLQVQFKCYAAFNRSVVKD